MSAPAPRRAALRVELVIGQGRRIAGLFCPGLIERVLVRARVDHGEHVAGLHLLALGEVDRLQVAIDLRPHLHRLPCLHGADAVGIYRQVLAFRLHHRHRHGVAAGRLGGGRLLAACRADQRQRAGGRHRDHHRGLKKLPCAPADHCPALRADHARHGTNRLHPARYGARAGGVHARGLHDPARIIKMPIR